MFIPAYLSHYMAKAAQNGWLHESVLLALHPVASSFDRKSLARVLSQIYLFFFHFHRPNLSSGEPTDVLSLLSTYQ